MSLYYSGVAAIDLLDEVRVAYCRTCRWEAAPADYRTACLSLAEHRRSHERAA